MPQNKPKRVYTQIFPDLPVRRKEGLEFKFEGLARTLAELAWNPGNRTPFSVVVRGDWGRGKTTLLRQVQRLLDEERDEAAGVRRVETIWFNAWKYPDDDTVFAGLLGALLDRMRRGSLWEQIKIHVDSQKNRLARMVLHAAAPWMFEADEEAGQFSGRYRQVEEKRAFHDHFRNLFGQASYLLFHGVEMLRDSEGRDVESLWSEAQSDCTVAIFLDDLDRCREPRVLEVLEAINLFLDLPGVCFYLGLDWDRLKAVLPEHLSGREEQFLEKIVQVRLDLPAISAEGAGEFIESLVRDTPLESVLRGESHDDVATIAEALESRHPRHVKRFLNDLSMGLAVLRNTREASEPPVPERAVVAWHLMLEVLPNILPQEEWREVRGLWQNVQGYMRRWSAASRSVGAKGVDENLAEVVKRGTLNDHATILAELERAQAIALINLGSPAREADQPAKLEVEGKEPVEIPASEEEVAAEKAFDLAELEGPVWVPIQAGTFRMGSDDEEENERPSHEVRLSEFRISRYPVTNLQYSLYVSNTSARPPHHWPKGKLPEGMGRHPVVNVSRSDAVAYSEWLGTRIGRGRVSLPTEAQWEFTARGIDGRTYPWGEEEPSTQRANFGNNVGQTTRVDDYPSGATPEGVHDLAGNVWEWCRDWYAPYSDRAAVDPAGPGSGSARVLRGGAFSNLSGRYLRSSFRFEVRPGPGSGDVNIGFRVAWSLPAKP